MYMTGMPKKREEIGLVILETDFPRGSWTAVATRLGIWMSLQQSDRRDIVLSPGERDGLWFALGFARELDGVICSLQITKSAQHDYRFKERQSIELLSCQIGHEIIWEVLR